MVVINRVNGRALYFHSREIHISARIHAYARLSEGEFLPLFPRSHRRSERGAFRMTKDEGRRRTKENAHHQCPFAGFMELLRLVTGLSSGGEILVELDSFGKNMSRERRGKQLDYSACDVHNFIRNMMGSRGKFSLSGRN